MTGLFQSIVATFLLMAVLWPSTSFAINKEGVVIIETNIEAKVNAIIRRFDPDGIALVTLSLRKRSAPLPGTIYKVKELSIAESEGGQEIDGVVIKVFTSRQPVPQTIQKFIHDAAINVSANVKTDFSRLPGELVGRSEEKRQKIFVENMPDLSKMGPAKVEPATPDPKKVQAEKGKSLDTAIAQRMLELTYSRAEEETAFRKTATTLAGVFLGLIALNLLLQFMGGRSLRDLVGGAVAALGKMGGGGTAAPAAAAVAAPTPGGGGGRGGGGGGGDGGGNDRAPSLLNQLPPAAFPAIFSDCYWSEADGFACYLWAQLDGKTKGLVLEKFPPMADYAAFFLDVEPEELGLEGDPYYLKPLPILMLSNDAIVEQVQSHPVLWKKLPQLRTQNMKMPALDRLRLVEEASSATGEAPDMSKLPASEPRKLPVKLRITEVSIDDENALFDRTDLAPEIKRDIPSLVWLAQKPAEQIAKVLQAHSAKNLATAWIGPEQVLEKLADELPGAKRELLESFQKTVKPSRQSPTFMALSAAGCVEDKDEDEEGSGEMREAA